MLNLPLRFRARSTASLFGLVGLAFHTGSAWVLIEATNVSDNVLVAMIQLLIYVAPVIAATLLTVGAFANTSGWGLFLTVGAIWAGAGLLASVLTEWIGFEAGLSWMSQCLDFDIHPVMIPACLGLSGVALLLTSYGIGSSIAGVVYALGILATGQHFLFRKERSRQGRPAE